MFSINNKLYLCTVDYHSEFPVIKQVKVFSTDTGGSHVSQIYGSMKICPAYQ